MKQADRSCRAGGGRAEDAKTFIWRMLKMELPDRRKRRRPRRRFVDAVKEKMCYICVNALLSNQIIKVQNSTKVGFS